MIDDHHFHLYFGGDSSYSRHFQGIGDHFDSIDVALLPVGPNEPRSAMKDAHLDVFESIQAFHDLKARCFIPMHWGTFRSGNDDFDYPIQILKKLWQQNEQSGCEMQVMKFGEAKNFGIEKS